MKGAQKYLANRVRSAGEKETVPSFPRPLSDRKYQRLPSKCTRESLNYYGRKETCMKSWEFASYASNFRFPRFNCYYFLVRFPPHRPNLPQPEYFRGHVGRFRQHYSAINKFEVKSTFSPVIGFNYCVGILSSLPRPANRGRVFHPAPLGWLKFFFSPPFVLDDL